MYLKKRERGEKHHGGTARGPVIYKYMNNLSSRWGEGGGLHWLTAGGLKRREFKPLDLLFGDFVIISKALS